MIEFRYLSNISDDELLTNTVILCVDERGCSCILVKNSKQKIIQNAYSTDNLEMILNSELLRDGHSHFFHIIKSKKTDAYSKKQFSIIYEYIFKKIDRPIDDVSMYGLLTSLEDLFKISPEKNLREFQIGVFGELFTLKYLYDLGCKQIGEKYHTNFYSKHDIEISNKLRIEIKTTTSEKRIHHFKHNQIARDDIDVIIVSLLLEESEEGITLYEMFEIIKPIIKDADKSFNLEKLKLKCGIDKNNRGMSFSFMKILQEIRFIDAKNAPKIPGLSYDGISNIEYDVDLSLCDYFSNDQLLMMLLESNN